MKDWNLAAPNPRRLAERIVASNTIQTWAFDRTSRVNALLGRITYYDALPDDEKNMRSDLEEYWKAIEVLNDVHLGFGALKGLKRKIRQKGVDALIAVDMLTGAFSNLFDISVLLAGDADFVPVVEEVKRRGVMVAIAGTSQSISDDLLRVADRFIDLPRDPSWFDPIILDNRAIYF